MVIVFTTQYLIALIIKTSTSDMKYPNFTYPISQNLIISLLKKKKIIFIKLLK